MMSCMDISQVGHVSNVAVNWTKRVKGVYVISMRRLYNAKLPNYYEFLFPNLQRSACILHSTLVSFLMSILPSLIRSHHFLISPAFISMNSAASVPALIRKQPVPSLPLLSTPKLDYCNSLYYNPPKSQTNRLRQIQNCLARTVVKAPKSSHITPILRSLHWLKINERIEYKLLSITYKVLTTSQPDYLHNLISVQSSGRTRSSSVVTLARPSVSSSLQITNRSFRYASPYLWNQLPSSFRQPHSVHCPPGSPHSAIITSSQSPSSLSLLGLLL